ncbi:MAG: hypothetical protein L0J75_01415 [Alkalibacterium sp.]|nr:hypothetical protein [Alkalibacterium sp.]
MRAADRVYFVTEGEEVFDPSTGDYIVGEPIRDLQWANVSDTGTERMTLLFGSIQQGAKTIRLNNLYKKQFDWIEFEGKKYKVQLSRKYQRRNVFEVVGK